MSDITMCTSEVCPKKKECYRHEAKPSEYWQSYADFTYFCGDNFVYFEPLETNAQRQPDNWE